MMQIHKKQNFCTLQIQTKNLIGIKVRRILILALKYTFLSEGTYTFIVKNTSQAIELQSVLVHRRRSIQYICAKSTSSSQQQNDPVSQINVTHAAILNNLFREENRCHFDDSVFKSSLNFDNLNCIHSSEFRLNYFLMYSKLLEGIQLKINSCTTSY